MPNLNYLYFKNVLNITVKSAFYIVTFQFCEGDNCVGGPDNLELSAVLVMLSQIRDEEWTGWLVVYFNFKYFVPIANNFENGEFN